MVFIGAFYHKFKMKTICQQGSEEIRGEGGVRRVKSWEWRVEREGLSSLLTPHSSHFTLLSLYSLLGQSQGNYN
jgi:hypothetical protein